MRRFLVQIPMAIVLVAAFASPAQAQFGGKLEVGGKLALGLAGEVSGKFNGAKLADDDLQPTVGLNFYAMYEVFKYIDVGGMFNFMFWRSDAMKRGAVDRNTWIEFNALIRAKYGFLKNTLHIYGAMPIGLTISIPSKDFKKQVAGLKTGAGVNLGLVAGVSYAFWKGLGAFFELGWTFHYTNNKAANNAELEGIFNQMALNFGMFYRF